jgi:hypothetical protein
MPSQLHLAFADGQSCTRPQAGDGPRERAREGIRRVAPPRRPPSPFSTPIWTLLAAEIAAR